MKIKPKFSIGDKVFYINEKRVVKEGVVFGVFTCFDKEPTWSDKTPGKFKEFQYFIDMKMKPKDIEWIPENSLFETKKALIDSL